MIRKSEERNVVRQDRRLGAEGYILVNSFINGEADLNGKGRMFANVTIAPHSGIGFHEHHGESEIYCILSGKAVYSENGKLVDVGPGDVTICPSGEGHGITNDNDEPVEMIALILYS